MTSYMTPAQLNLTQQNFDNLVTLANFLEGHVTDDKFNMGLYATSFTSLRPNECNTAACAAGWSIAAGIESDYSQQFTGDPILFYWHQHISESLLPNGNDNRNNAREWMFAAKWQVSNVLSTVEAAVLRIRYFLENGLPNGSWNPRNTYRLLTVAYDNPVFDAKHLIYRRSLDV